MNAHARRAPDRHTTPGLVGLPNSPVDKAEVAAERVGFERHLYEKEGIVLRPARAADTMAIFKIYWRQMMAVRMGMPPEQITDELVQNDPGLSAIRATLPQEIRRAIAAGPGTVAVRGNEILGFLLTKSHPDILEGTDLNVVPSARGLGIGEALIEHTRSIAVAAGYSAFIGANGDYWENKRRTASLYLGMKDTRGYALTDDATTCLYEFRLPSARHSHPPRERPKPGPRRSGVGPGRGVRVVPATAEDALAIARLSEADPTIATLSTHDVLALLSSGPASVVKVGNEIIGYGATKMLPGVLELVSLCMKDPSRSGDVEANILLQLQERGRAYGLDEAIVVVTDGPIGAFTHSFYEAFEVMGYIDYAFLGQDDSVLVMSHRLQGSTLFQEEHPPRPWRLADQDAPTVDPNCKTPPYPPRDPMSTELLLFLTAHRLVLAPVGGERLYPDGVPTMTVEL